MTDIELDRLLTMVRGVMDENAFRGARISSLVEKLSDIRFEWEQSLSREMSTFAELKERRDEVFALTVELNRLKVFEARMRDVVTHAALRPVEGQQIYTQKYQMSTNTLKEMHRIIRDHGSVNSPEGEPPTQERS